MNPLTDAEYRDRQAATIAIARARACNAMLAWARGASRTTLPTSFRRWTGRLRTMVRGACASPVGGEALGARWERALRERVAQHGEVQFDDADDFVWTLGVVKSAAEQALMRLAGALGTRAMTAAMAAAIRGATESDVVAACVAEVIRAGRLVWRGTDLRDSGRHVRAHGW